MMPFMPVAPGGMTMPTTPEEQIGIDPQMIMRMLVDMGGDEFKPKIPPGYKKAKKPSNQEIWEGFQREEARNNGRVKRMMDTIRRLRFDIIGVFPSDVDARNLGDQDQWVSSDLVDDWNLLTAILSAMDEGFVKATLQRANRVGAQTMEDAAKLFREEMIYRWASTGDMPLPMAEAKILTSYGEVIWRVICNLDDPDFPFDVRLVDPASVHRVGGGFNGPKKLYRGMRMSYADALLEWGEPNKEGRRTLEDKYGKDESQVITVCEYADNTWRAAVTHDGIALLPIVEHKYYDVPFVIQGGPAGEPLFTDTARAGTDDLARVGGGWWRSGPSDDWGMEHKLVSSIHLQRERHDQLEAFMARVVTSAMDATNPALVITRDNLTAGTPLPRIDRRRGKVNEIGMGEQVQAVPSVINPQDFNAILGQATQDKQTGGIPLGMYGTQPGSNITGNSMSVAAESGMDHITPWITALETGRTRVVEKMFCYWRNKGQLSKFHGGEERPFMVPVSKPTTGQELARELTPQLIDAIGPRVRVVMNRLRPQEALQWAQVAGQLIPLGVSTRRRMAEKIGETDYDRLREEWQEEADWDAMNADESLLKEVRIPMKLVQWAEEAQSEEERAMFMAMLDRYMENRQIEAQAMAAQQQAGIAGGPSGQPPMGLPGSAPPQVGGLGGNTMNMAGLGAGPGTQGAPVGAPSGPFGPPQI
jgi:hypothetical protein